MKLRLTYPNDYHSDEDAEALLSWCKEHNQDYEEIIANLDTSALTYLGAGDWDYDFEGSEEAISALVDAPDFPPLWVSIFDKEREEFVAR